jgi:hypothetical protein
VGLTVAVPSPKCNVFLLLFNLSSPAIPLRLHSKTNHFTGNNSAGAVLIFLLLSQNLMKRWAFLTAFIYALALVLLAVPAIVICFSGKNGFSVAVASTVYREWAYWLWLAVLVAGQALLLLLPINIAEKRQPARRNLKIPVIVGGFFLSLLVVSAALSLLCGFYGDNVPARYNLGYDLGGQDNNAIGALLTAVETLLIFWLLWMMILRRATANDDPASLVKRAMRWLLRGSILELLIAVPSHVIVRRRGDCCAPIGTFWGIATGISVMLLCFGPAVFFLFAERFQRLKPKETLVTDITKI